MLNSPLSPHRGDMKNAVLYSIGVISLLLTLAAITMMFLALVEISK
jgi:hypothetical protein